jgi:hypothetical protein
MGLLQPCVKSPPGQLLASSTMQVEQLHARLTYLRPARASCVSHLVQWNGDGPPSSLFISRFTLPNSRVVSQLEQNGEDASINRAGGLGEGF